MRRVRFAIPAGVFLLAVIAVICGQRWVARRILPPFSPIVITAADAPSGQLLEVTCCRNLEETAFLRVMGTARNLSDNPLKNVIAQAAFLDHEGRRLASAQALLVKPILMPGKTSKFLLVTPVDLKIASVSVEFHFPGGDAIPVKHIRDGDSASLY